MKVAIIGSGPLAIEMAINLHLEEASVTIFGKGEMGGAIRKLYSHLGESPLGNDFESITTKAGRSLISKDLKNIGPSIKNYWDEYLRPLSEQILDFGIYKKAEVIRIKKSFISPKDNNRLRDLFRVYYSFDPKESILKSIEENPKVFEKLGREVLDSLNEKMEFFEDFDLVIDARGVFSNPNPMGSSQGEALNELVLAKDSQVYYGISGFDNLEKIKKDTILIVGSGELALTYLDKLENWFLSNSNRKIYLVTEDKNPFEMLKNKKIFKDSELEFEKKVQEFQNNINIWKALEDYEKVKIPKPQEPGRRFEVFSGSTISSLDKLLDKTDLFVTIDGQSGLRTLAMDIIFVATGFKIDPSIFKGMHMDFDYGEKTAKNIIHTEPGIYTLGPVIKERRYTLLDGLEQIPLIWENMLSFFSKKA